MHLNITDASLSDGENLYPTLEENIRPSSNSLIYGLARATDGTTTDCNIAVSSSGNLKLNVYHYGTKTFSGIVADGFYSK